MNAFKPSMDTGGRPPEADVVDRNARCRRCLFSCREKIEPEVVENMRSWEHSGFSVDQSVFLPAGDQAGIERLIQYMTRLVQSVAAR